MDDERRDQDAVTLPDSFLSGVGEANREWRARVPALMETYLQRWGLHLDGEFILGNNAVVQLVRTAGGTPAGLRLQDQQEVSDWIALELWDGDGAVRLFDHDQDDGVLLLERLDHTKNLDALPIDDAATVAGRLRARLSRPAPPQIRTLQASAAQWAQELPDAPMLPPRIVDEAVSICQSLGPGATQYLVNEDQYYHNVLAADREPWLVIDPTILAGDCEYGLTPLIYGRLEESTTDRLMATFIETEDLDPDKARAWTFVGAVLKWANSQGRVAHNCKTIATALSAPT